MAVTPTSVARPAAQVFAAAIAAAGSIRRRLPSDPEALLGAPIASALAAAAPSATDVATRAPIDLRTEVGAQGMIDHIEALRDGLDARDTRIRLSPDALGGVDVAVRRDGDTVHVRFTADNATTRTLLAEAQPRLATLAEARGVRLGDTVVDGGGQGGGASGAGTSGDGRADHRGNAPAPSSRLPRPGRAATQTIPILPPDIRLA